eukprot:CAMPEP_0197538726 /NCGR_PEP_ID=MMETSP1318-20131121/60447_1 /TAXON_ID=552666 /ORGANISM="Partenskyella glossopodia, Strain RCC365" /LENGTH=130 /DNA_ID=CAMNT_0043097219 /DNA_START=32 /DNA_END=424 /DNA_ORIENTATION=+
MNKPRYALKNFKHPYKPWEVKDDESFRGYRATVNQVEWLVYAIPTYTFAVIFSPMYPVVGAVNVGQVAPWFCYALSVLYCKGNIEYLKGYMKSAEDRIPGFKLRLNAFKGMFFTLCGGMVCYGARSFDVI